MLSSRGWVGLVIAGAIAAGASGCSESARPVLESRSTDTTPRQSATRLRPVVTPVADQLVAADPELPGFDGWDLVFGVRFHDPAHDTCAIEVARDAATLATLAGVFDATSCRARWNGRDASGHAVDPGLLVATARVVDGSGAELSRGAVSLEVVRLGIDRVDLAGAGRAPLLYRQTAGISRGWYEVGVDHVVWQIAPDRTETAAAPLELADRTPRPLPMPLEDVLSPALDASAIDGVEHDTFTMPTAWVAGSTATATLRFTSSIAGTPAGGEPHHTQVRAVAPSGTTIMGADTFGDGRAITLVPAASLAPEVDRYDITWNVGFEARTDAGEWQPIPGAFPITFRVYGIVAQPVMAQPDVPHRPWVDVVDRIARWVHGTAHDEQAVGAAIVQGVYGTLGLRYDTARGASFYTEYTTDFGGAVFHMAEFQGEEWGHIVNCSDSASIVSTYANMVGIDFRYHILTNRRGIDLGFDLNFIKAIGMPAFDDTPFDSGRGAFRYHAIVGSRDGRTWDATLEVDGDGTPTAAPFTERLVQGLDAHEYLVDLSSVADQIRTDYDDRVRVQ